MKIGDLYKKPLKDIVAKLKPIFSKQQTLECRVCHDKIKKGDIYVETPGVEGYVCHPCDDKAMKDLIYERPLASLDDK